MVKQREPAQVRRARLAKAQKEKISREDKALFDRLREGIAGMEKEVEEENKARLTAPPEEKP
jgi:hypothetical protein